MPCVSRYPPNQFGRRRHTCASRRCGPRLARQARRRVRRPTTLDDVFSPPVELVVVVGVVELLGRVHVPGVHDTRAGVAGVVDEGRHRLDRRLARLGGVEAPVGVTEPVLHVDDDHRGLGRVVRHVREFDAWAQKSPPPLAAPCRHLPTPSTDKLLIGSAVIEPMRRVLTLSVIVAVIALLSIGAGGAVAAAGPAVAGSTAAIPGTLRPARLPQSATPATEPIRRLLERDPLRGGARLQPDGRADRGGAGGADSPDDGPRRTRSGAPLPREDVPVETVTRSAFMNDSASAGAGGSDPEFHR